MLHNHYSTPQALCQYIIYVYFVVEKSIKSIAFMLHVIYYVCSRAKLRDGWTAATVKSRGDKKKTTPATLESFSYNEKLGAISGNNRKIFRYSL